MNFKAKVKKDDEVIEQHFEVVQTAYREDKIGDVMVYAPDTNFRVKGTTVGFQISYKGILIRRHFSTVYNAVIFIQEIFFKEVYPVIEEMWKSIIAKLNQEVKGGDESISDAVNWEAEPKEGSAFVSEDQVITEPEQLVKPVQHGQLSMFISDGSDEDM